MQTSPNPNHSADQPASEPSPAVRSESAESGKIQNDINSHEAQSQPHRPALVKESVLFRSYRWCRKRVWDSWRFDNRPSFFDALTSTVALIGVFFLVHQSRQTNAALQQASEANRLTRTAQEQAADALIHEQRAYVAVTGLEIELRRGVAGPGQTETWRATPIVVNTGNTPTRNARWIATGNDWDLAFNVNDPRPPGRDDFRNAYLNELSLVPRQEARGFAHSAALPVEYTAAVSSQKMRVYIHGAITYNDVFSTKRHITRYCYFLWARLPFTNPPDLTYSQCHGNANCTDEECRDYEDDVAVIEKRLIEETK